MKVNANALRAGAVIDHSGRLCRVVRVRHTQPGKSVAYVQVELKDIRDGTKLHERFRSSEAVERIRLEEHPYQYLYSDGATYTFMDLQTFDQVSLERDLVGEDKVHFLQDNMEVTIERYEGMLISVQLEGLVTLEVVETGPVLKGQTATSVYKPAVLENGVRVMVPPHIGQGKRIVVNTSDGSYVERATD